MSDLSAACALRSPDRRLVVIEAPAGSGKTYQAALYAREAAAALSRGRVLILAHTHAACDVFASRTRGLSTRVEIRTIDSLISEIADAYHISIGLPPHAGAWARCQKDGYKTLAVKVAALLRRCPAIVRAIVDRYPVLIFDEHQDASVHQHDLGLACLAAGALVRVLGDPMQMIYNGRQRKVFEESLARWERLKGQADAFETLEEPHRWSDGSQALGDWIMSVRRELKQGGQVDLRGTLPPGVRLMTAENESAHPRGLQYSQDHANPIRKLTNTANSLLVLSSQKETVESLRAMFGRRLPIWEGHVRDSLSEYIESVKRDKGTAAKLAEALVKFIQQVCVGFSPSGFGNILLEEIRSGCSKRRSGKPAMLQSLARHVLAEPDHVGGAKLLRQLKELTSVDAAFEPIKIDYGREYSEAIQLGQFNDPDEGFAEIARRRHFCRPMPPSKAISTVHKAKGLECDHVLVVPCDAAHFSNSMAARCKFYVAISRAKKSLTLVVSRQAGSPLVLL